MKAAKKVELLAPAGNAEAFYGAIHAGADAIYLGGSRFGARAYAENFSEEELVACIRYAHLFQRKVYLTVNTLVKESEFSGLYEYVLPYYRAGLDGVIVQDMGVFAYLREHFPRMELHGSTQMTITGEYGAAFLKEQGACRVVPARELSLAEIRRIKEVTGLEIECFIHGAMCYCYSGQCLFSSILGGRSGNRGRCAQPCRLPYTTGKHPKECYPLSLKDMCTIEYIPELLEAGIDSFKIEGRMKKPEYAAGVTAIYRKYIDRYYADSKAPQKISAADMHTLSCLYIRSERQDGYYHKHNGGEMVTLDSPAYSGSDETLLQNIRKEHLEHRLTLPVSMQAEFLTGETAKLYLWTGESAVTVEGNVVEEASRQPITQENIAKQLGKLGDSHFHLEDSLGRTWQCGTIQLDFQMPQRFDLEYTGADGGKHRPVMVHRVIFGSIERFMGILIEHYAGKFPVWLAPVQVKVLSVSEKSFAYANEVYDRLKDAGVRVALDNSDEKIGYKIRQAQLQKVPYMLVLGEKESDDGTIVTVRTRDGKDLGQAQTDMFIAHVLKQTAYRNDDA